jgi:hypothetical protein
VGHPTKAPFKRLLSEQSAATPQDSPTKKKFKNTKEKAVGMTAMASESSESEAIAEGGEKKGLLKFFHRETPDEREQRMRRERVDYDIRQQKAAEEAILKAGREAAAKEKERFEAKMRKRKSRSKRYDCERAAGLRDKNLRLKRCRVS